MDQNLISTEKKTIEINEVDDMGEYFFHHLLNLFSQIATVNAMKIGVWNQAMMSQYGWVVAKQYLHLDEPIRYQDEIELSTTISKGSFVSFPRYYYIKKNQKVIGTCSSVWTLLDIQKRRMVSPQKIGIIFPEVSKEPLLDLPPMIQKNLEMTYIKDREVLYSDVDINQHMNNTCYIQWALDLIDFDKHHQCYIRDINIQYRKDIRPREMVKLFMGEDDHRYLIEGRNEQDDVYFTIEIYFYDR